MRAVHDLRRPLLPIAVAIAVVAAACGSTAPRHARPDAPSHHPDHQTDRFVVREALRGGEVEGERSSPAAFEAANRAFPARAVDPALGRAAARIVARRAAAARRSTVRAASPLLLWKPLGPAGVDGPLTGLDPSGKGGVVSGRVTALAVSPSCDRRRCDVYLGAAGGGVWRTAHGLAATPVWTPLWDAMPTTAIGSIAIDPAHPSTIYVGSGEANGSNDSQAGLGIFRSTDRGRTWHQLPNAPFLNLSVATIAIDPRNPRVLYAGTSAARRGASGIWGGRAFPPGTATPGVWRSRDGGQHWRRVLVRRDGRDFFGGVVRVLVSPRSSRIVYAGVLGYGIYSSRDGGRRWRRILNVRNAPASADRPEFDIPASDPDRLYAFLGSDGGGQLWVTRQARRARPAFYRTSSTSPSRPGSDVADICGDQCAYDLFVRADPLRRDVVYVGGSAAYDDIYGNPDRAVAPGESNGRIVVRSSDGGRSFTDMTSDIAGDGLHPDAHAFAFARDTRIWFTGNDGGIWRSSGTYADRRSSCSARQLGGAPLARCRRRLKQIPRDLVSLNRGLDTLQFQGLGLDRGSTGSPGSLATIIGGTQDNGSLRLAGGAWANVINGDGGQAAIGAGNPALMWHTYYDPQVEVSVAGGSPESWTWVADPLLASRETASFYVPLQADREAAATAYVGLERVWRTTDAGGMTGPDAASVALKCASLTGTFPDGYECGDWAPLSAEKLTGPAYGTDKAGEFITWIHQSPDNPDVAYAATRSGRVLRSDDVRAANPGDVTWLRVDTAAMPQRFVSGVVNAPADPGHAYVAFSGYGTTTPTTPGHVYSIDGSGAHDVSYDLPDAPITALAIDRRNGDLYAGCDFGVWRLAAATTSWTWFSEGLPRTSVFWLEVHDATNTLVAATHGRGAWTLALP